MVISRDTVDWLLEEENPSVRYFTLLNLLDGKESDRKVVEAKKRIMAEGAVAKILSRQNRNGSFLTDGMKKKCTAIAPRSGYQPKYKGTIWQAIFLAQLGADPKGPGIKKLCEYILDTNYLPGRQVIGLHVLRSRPGDYTMPCH